MSNELAAPNPEPFHFMECVALLRLSGTRAADLPEFLDALKTVSPGSIFHHTHQYFLKPLVEVRGYPNDFAVWAANNLEDKALAERLANLNPFLCKDIEEVRAELVRITEDHLAGFPAPRPVIPGNEFFFSEVTTLVIPTGLVATDLQGFLKAIVDVDDSGIYFHFYEARLRLGNDRGDFTRWFEDSLGRKDLADELRELALEMSPTEVVREKIVSLIRKVI